MANFDPKEFFYGTETILTSISIGTSLDQNKLFVSESLVSLTQLAKWYKEPTKQFSEL